MGTKPGPPIGVRTVSDALVGKHNRGDRWGMSEALHTYLHDHLAGATFALNLLETLTESHRGESLGTFASGLRSEVEADRALLQDLAERVGSDPSAVKNAAGWLSEKVAGFKLRQHSGSPLGTFESLETLALGIMGKRALWDALAIAAVRDPRLGNMNFEQLALSATDQHRRVEEQRLRAAADALCPAPAGT